MKRALILALSLLTLLPGAALADLLWEPYEDSFYQAHREECVPQQPSRSYVANGPEGRAPLYPAPDQPASGEIANGEEISIPWLYTAPDGSRWGYALYRGEEWGWVNLYDLLLVYDSQSFMEEHGEEIKQETVSVQAMCGEDGFIFWSYPLSGKQELKWDMAWGDYDGMVAESTYTDPEGRLWGYVGYWQGRRNGWICLSDPLNENLGPAEPSAREEGQEQAQEQAQAPLSPDGLPLMDTGAPPYTPSDGLPLPCLGLILGAGAAALAAVMIRLLGKKNQGK